ncbi:MAG: PAS domain S-box protein [Alphaproteobacteria bacterium]|jgi:PAS domain S-box-containing protein|nr:PAS domain S-box protein [Alphaproteobacteria bacterium]
MIEESSLSPATAAAALASADALIAILDAEGRVVFFNNACERLTGYGEAEIRGRRLWDVLMDGTEAAEATAVFESLTRDRRPSRQRMRWRSKDGRDSLIEWSNAVVAGDGGVSHVVGTGFDVGDWQATAETLQQREAFLRSIIETAVDGVITIDESGRVQSFSPAAERLFGYSADDIVGRNVNLLMPETEQDEHDFYLARYADTGDKRIIGAGRELMAVRKDGTTFPIDLAVSEFSVEGRRMFTGIVRDITDRRRTLTALHESQQRLRELAESASDWFWETDRNDRLIFVSSRLEELFGVPVAEEIGKFRLDGALAEDSDDWRAHLDDIDARRPFRDFRYTRSDSEGRLHHVRLSGRPRLDESGAFLGYRGVGSDVTAGVESERAARRAAEELQQAQKMEAIGQLTGGIAHDFNNLLTVIFGNLEMLELELEGDSQRFLITEALEAAELGAELTDRLLAFARRQPLEPKLLNLNDMVDGMRDLLARSLPESIQIVAELADLPCRTRVDPGQAENAILNLAINARDAMPDGGTIRLTTTHLAVDGDYDAHHPDLTAGDYVVLSIADDGTGMSAEVLERAFEPFFTTKDAGAGTGLGLSTIFGFAKQSGGLARIESAPGAGTTVWVYLPAAEGSREAAATRSRALAETGGEGETVLVVEDDERVRRITVKRLEELGYQVVVADSGPRAMEVMEASPDVELLFSDFVMPGGMTGADLADRLKRRHPGLKVLLTSGYADPDKLARETPEGEVSLLRKPYSLRQLAAALRDAIEG